MKGRSIMAINKNRILQAFFLIAVFSIFCIWQYGLSVNHKQEQQNGEILTQANEAAADEPQTVDDRQLAAEGKQPKQENESADQETVLTAQAAEHSEDYLTEEQLRDMEEQIDEIKNMMEEEEKIFSVTTYEEVRLMYAVDMVNVRTGPDTSYERVGALTKAQEVTVTGMADTGWYQIKLHDEPAYVSNKYLQGEKPAEINIASLEVNAPETASAPQQESIQVQEAQQAETVQAQTPASQQVQTSQAQAKAPQNTAGVIFVGDSRTVQMREAAGDNPYTWIAQNSKGYKWLKDNAMERIDNNVGKGTKIVILLGVNDANHYRDYLELINAKAPVWVSLGATVYFSSCNQVMTNPYTSEEEVATFNQKMQEGLCGDVKWIDSFSYLQNTGYRLVDGVHFDAETSLKLYSFYLGSI